jgi:hypothetical protein
MSLTGNRVPWYCLFTRTTFGAGRHIQTLYSLGRLQRIRTSLILPLLILFHLSYVYMNFRLQFRSLVIVVDQHSQQKLVTMSVEEHSKAAMLQDNTEEPQQQLYGHSLFSTALRSSRKLLLRSLVLPIMYTSLLMWACLSLYWGSTTYTSLRKLSVYAINLDDGSFGRQMITDIKSAASEDPAGLGWQFESAVKSATMSQELVLDEKAWAVVQSMYIQHWTTQKNTDGA